MYRRGEFASLQEGADIAAVSRRRVLAWLNAAGIDPDQTRAAWQAKVARRAAQAIDGKGRKARQTKAQTRAETARKVAEYKAQGGRVRRL